MAVAVVVTAPVPVVGAEAVAADQRPQEAATIRLRIRVVSVAQVQEVCGIGREAVAHAGEAERLVW